MRAEPHSDKDLSAVESRRFIAEIHVSVPHGDVAIGEVALFNAGA